MKIYLEGIEKGVFRFSSLVNIYELVKAPKKIGFISVRCSSTRVFHLEIMVKLFWAKGPTVRPTTFVGCNRLFDG